MGQPTTVGWKEATISLAELLARNVVCLQAEAGEAVARDAQSLLTALASQTDAQKGLLTVGALVDLVRSHNKSTQSGVDELVTGMREMLHLIVNYARVCDEEATSTSADELWSSLESAQGAEAASVRSKLASVIEVAKLREGRRRASAREMADELRERLGRLQRMPELAQARQVAAVDATTGLPSRAEAEQALREAQSADRPLHLAIFYSDRISLTNVRFGYAVGDQVLMLCSQQIATQLIRPGDALFRWTGPAFLALLEREDNAKAVLGEIHHFLSTPMNRYFELPFRTVYLPVKMLGETFPLKGVGFDEALDRIDRFMLRAARHSL